MEQQLKINIIMIEIKKDKIPEIICLKLKNFLKVKVNFFPIFLYITNLLYNYKCFQKKCNKK